MVSTQWSIFFKKRPAPAGLLRDENNNDLCTSREINKLPHAGLTGYEKQQFAVLVDCLDITCVGMPVYMIPTKSPSKIPSYIWNVNVE